MLSKCNSLSGSLIKSFIQTKPEEIFRAKVISNFTRLGKDELVISCNSGSIMVVEHGDSKCKDIATL